MLVGGLRRSVSPLWLRGYEGACRLGNRLEQALLAIWSELQELLLWSAPSAVWRAVPAVGVDETERGDGVGGIGCGGHDIDVTPSTVSTWWDNAVPVAVINCFNS